MSSDGVPVSLTAANFAINSSNVSFIETGSNQAVWSGVLMGGDDSTIAKKEKRQSIFKKFFCKKSEKQAPVTAVFKAILSNKQEIAEFKDRTSAINRLIGNARKAGQISLVEKLEQENLVSRFESALYVKDFRKFLTEEQLLRFVKNCEKGLCLDWIKHFTRIIPQSVLKEKFRADNAELFDNYVVLHFDPDNKATLEKDRAEAARKAKDPILFGVVRGSRKLYFIGDWVDELCDLTLQQIADKLGEELEMK